MSQADLKKTVKENRSEIEQYIKYLVDAQKKLESNLQKTEKDFRNSFEHQKTNLFSSLTSTIRDLETIVERFDSDKNQMFRKDVEDFKKELRQIMSNTKSDTESSLTNFESIITKLENSTTNLLRSQSKDILRDISDVYSGERDSIDFLAETLTSSVDRLRRSYENSVEQEIENLKSSTKILYDNIITGLDKFRSETGRITKIGEDKVEGTLEEAVQEIQSGFEGSTGSLRDVMRSIESKVQKVFSDRTEEFTNILKNVANNFSTTVETEKTQTYKIYEKGHDILSRFKETELDSFSRLLTDAKSNFLKSLELNSSKMEKDFEAVKHSFQKNIHSSLTTITNSFESFYSTVNSWVAGIENSLTNAKDELDKQKEKLIDQPIKNMKIIAEKMETQLSEFLSELQSTYKSDKDKMQSNLDSKLAKYGQDYSKNLENLNNSLLKLIKESIDTQKSSFDTIKGDLNIHLEKTLTGSEETLNKAYLGITGDFSQFTQNQEHWQKTTSDDISRRLKDGKSRVVMDLEGIVPQIVSLTDSFRGNYEEVIKRAMSAMDSAIQLFKREDSDESSKAHSVIDTHMRDVEKRINNRQDQSSNLINQLFDQLDIYQKDAFSKIKDDLRTKFTNLSTRYNSVEESIGSQTENIVARHFENSNNFIESSQNKIQSITKTSNTFQENYEQIQTKVKEELESALRNISIQIHTVADRCNNIVDSSNEFLKVFNSQPKQKTP